MTTPHWTEKWTRPMKNGCQTLISYEIYGKQGLSEHDTIIALNELVEEGKAESFFNKDGLWYVKKERPK